MATAVEEARAALLNIEQKYEQSIVDYATAGFMETLARGLMLLPPEKQELVLQTYPMELRQKVVESLNLTEANAEVRPDRQKRTCTYMLAQSDLLTPEDYLLLEDKLIFLAADDYEALYNEVYEKNPWLAEKMSLLSNRIPQQLQESPGESYVLLHGLSFAQIHALYAFGDQQTKDWILKNMSKNNQKDMFTEFARMGEAKKEDYVSALRRINDWSSKQEAW